MSFHDPYASQDIFGGSRGHARRKAMVAPEVAAEEGLVVLGWRELPVDASPVGPSARAVMPRFAQLAVRGARGEDGLALERLASVDGLRILGPNENVDRGGAISFTLATPDGTDVHPHDLMQFLDSRGIAVRGGHHCARPLHERFGIQSSTRASFYLYTTRAEIDALVDGLHYTVRFFGGAR